jgi:hypothetical protein
MAPGIVMHRRILELIFKPSHDQKDRFEESAVHTEDSLSTFEKKEDHLMMDLPLQSPLPQPRADTEMKSARV